MGLKPVKVGQLNSYINRVLSTDPILGNVSVIGEISNLKFHSSGHVYFSMKDETSRVNCFLAAGNLSRIKCPLEEGMEIVATGYISVYQRGGYYSLNIRDIESNGAGQLAIRFERLKAQLEKEGLFLAENKKEIPAFPETVAVVTSDTGAAVRDIIRTIKNKNNYVNILICPVLVQGPSAPPDIVRALDTLNSDHSYVDVIITGRGGGSMEELWAFNDEEVARAIFRSEIPVISAVGHETDFTIADFVADARAATPTAAAELAVPDIEEIRNYLENLRDNLNSELGRTVERRRDRLRMLDPDAFSAGIRNRIAYEQVNLERIMEANSSNLKSRLESARNRVNVLGSLLQASDPDLILGRGYSIVSDADGNIIRDTASLEADQQVHIRAASGRAEARITRIIKEDL